MLFKSQKQVERITNESNHNQRMIKKINFFVQDWLLQTNKEREVREKNPWNRICTGIFKTIKVYLQYF